MEKGDFTRGSCTYLGVELPCHARQSLSFRRLFRAPHGTVRLSPHSGAGAVRVHFRALKARRGR